MMMIMMITIYCDVLLKDNGDDIKLTMIILWLIEMNKEDMNDDNNNTDKDVLWYVVKRQWWWYQINCD